jgi:hypothetical protein
MRSFLIVVAIAACAVGCDFSILAADEKKTTPAESSSKASTPKPGETATEAMLRTESLGGLRLGLPENDVLKLLGPPTKRGKLVLQEADGNYVQDWHYGHNGIKLLMSAGEKKSGVKTIANITASAPCTFATSKDIKIGSPESAVRKAYAAYVDREENTEPDTLVVGSVYSGIIFNFTEGKVSRIFFGAAAE